MVCAATNPLKPIAAGCRVTVPAGTGHETRKWFIRVWRVRTWDGYEPQAHCNCVCNEIVAIRNRVTGAVPQPTVEGLRLLRRTARSIKRYLPRVAPVTFEAVCSKYSGAKRARYTQAAHYSRGGLCKADARIKMFCKTEFFNPLRKNRPDPRAIQFRDPKFGVWIARWLFPMEHYLYNLHGNGKILPDTRLIGKGLSQRGRAALFLRKWRKFEDPVCVSLDASRFDQHVSRKLLQIEHGYYLHMNSDREFQRLCSWQLRNIGRSMNGVRYKTDGRRMSGDMNTALGNCVLMVTMVAACMRGKKYEMLDDGDDCLLIVERSLLKWVIDNVPRIFLLFGMELKIENISDSIEGVEWCQCHPVQTGDGSWTFVRNPVKVMTQSLTGVKYFQGDRRKLVNSIGHAELALNAGVPVLQEFALALIRNADTVKLMRCMPDDPLFYRLGRHLRAEGLNFGYVKAIPVTNRARWSYAKAFGVSIPRQLAMERFLKHATFPVNGIIGEARACNTDDWFVGCSHSAEASPHWDL